jgi:Tfp pilus assembly protein PilF
LEADWGLAAGDMQPPATVMNGAAWFFATVPFEDLRRPTLAVELARKIVDADPGSVPYWNTLGAALYSDGKFPEAIEALQRSMALPGGDVAYNWVFLAMASARQKDQDQARVWHDKSAAWLRSQPKRMAQLEQFLLESARLVDGERRR